MAIRLRRVDGLLVALCAAETDPRPGDVYLDDAQHYALAAKFSRDFRATLGFEGPTYPEEWAAMDSQKVRDAEAVLLEWLAEQDGAHG